MKCLQQFANIERPFHCVPLTSFPLLCQCRDVLKCVPQYGDPVRSVVYKHMTVILSYLSFAVYGVACPIDLMHS